MQVIGFRGSVPYSVGVFRPVYLCRVNSSEWYAFGDEVFVKTRSPMRAVEDVDRFTRLGIITRLKDIVPVSATASVVCITQHAEAYLSHVLPMWKNGKGPLDVCSWKDGSKARISCSDEPAHAFVVPEPEAATWLKTTIVRLWAVMDERLLQHKMDPRAAAQAEAFGWIAWGMLGQGGPGMRRETMTRIVAAHAVRRSGIEYLVHQAARSLGLSSDAEMKHFSATYLRTGSVPFPET